MSKVYAVILESMDGSQVSSLHATIGSAQSRAAVFNSWRSAEPIWDGGEREGPEWDEYAERWNAWFSNAPGGLSCGYDGAAVSEMEVLP